MSEYELQLGGSGKGINYWLGYAECSLRSKLNAEAVAPSLEAETDEDAPVLLGNEGRNIGTLYHAYLHRYHETGFRDFKTLDFNLKGGAGLTIDEEARYEAERLAYYYADEVAPDWLGKPVSFEHYFPRNKGDMAKLMSVGFPEAPTARIDMVTSLSKKGCEALALKFGLDLVPGIYIIDHKTERAHTKGLANQYLYSAQLYWYQWVARECLGLTVQGAIASCIIKKKEPELVPIVQPQIGRWEEQVLKSFARTCSERKAGEANLSACFGKYGQVCDHLTTGRCKRYTEGHV